MARWQIIAGGYTLIIQNRIESMLDAGAVFEIEADKKTMAFLAGGIAWLPENRFIWGKPFFSSDATVNEFDFHLVTRRGEAIDDGEIVTIPIRDGSGKSVVFRVVPIELSESFGGPEMTRAQTELKKFRDMLRAGQRPEWFEMLEYVRQTQVKEGK